MRPDEIDMASAAVATAPRVTLDMIKDSIMVTYYIDGQRIAQHASHTDVSGKQVPFPPNLEVFTVCMVVVRNGFIVLGKSAPASPENYNSDIGRQFAYDDAIKQLWQLQGYALRETLYQRDRAMGQPHHGHP